MPRGATQYRRLDFSALPPRQRAPAARIALARDALPGALTRLAWADGIAHVWTWTPEAPVGARERANWMPESLVRPRPVADGPRLVAQMDGVEGQVWTGGDLVASQWWPRLPTVDAWHRFLRSASIAAGPGGQVPEPSILGWSSPWARLRGGSAGAQDMEAWAWRIAISGVVAALGWQLAALEAERDALASLTARTEALRAQAMPLLDARERADRARADIDRYRGLQRGTSDYSLMAAVMLPLEKDARLVAWNRQGDQLKAKIVAETTDPREFVKAYDRIRLLADVQAAPASPAGMALEFKLPEAFKAGTEK